MSELSLVQGVTERLAKKILSDYEYDMEKLSQVNPVKLSVGYNGVGVVTANRIKAWAAAAVQKTMTPQWASGDGPRPDISKQVEITEPPQLDTSDQAEVSEGPLPPASARVQRIRAAGNG